MNDGFNYGYSRVGYCFGCNMDHVLDPCWGWL